MTPNEILVKAKALIDRPEKWTKGTWARDAVGNVATPHGSYAKCFCAIGAMARVRGPSLVNYAAYIGAKEALTKAKPHPHLDIPGWNDSRDTTHAEVMAVFDKAIEATS